MIPGLAAKGMPKEQIAEVLANLRTTVGRPATTSTGITSPPCVDKTPGARLRARSAPEPTTRQVARRVRPALTLWVIIINEVALLPLRDKAPGTCCSSSRRRCEQSRWLLSVEPAVHGSGWAFETTLTAMFGWIRHHADVPTLQAVSFRLLNCGIYAPQHPDYYQRHRQPTWRAEDRRFSFPATKRRFRSSSTLGGD